MADAWNVQAKRDLAVANLLAEKGYDEWACYAAQQAAEKAIKSIRHAMAIDLHDSNKWSHDLSDLARPLLALVPKLLPPHLELIALTNHEADGRYPGLRSGAYQSPGAANVYGSLQSAAAIKTAHDVVNQCDDLFGSLQEFWAGVPPWQR
ncbi:MAG TPA: HEPN domain-containing protein [Kofleriaceae bacterium]|nr:HEPN domain-containing protein [Kofleriaceae bacterium]